MKAREFFPCAILLLGCSLWAQTQPEQPPSESELAAIAARGRALAEYDAAAWHASDAVIAVKPAANLVRLYVARKTEKGWVLAFGRFDEAKTRFLTAYEAQQDGSSNEYSVVRHDPPLEDADFYFRAARALELAKAEFLRDAKPRRPYNFSILPAPPGEWYFYAIPAQTDLSVLPYGGDVRYKVSADGTKITEKRQMHKTVLEEQVGEKGPFFGFHTHVLSNIPEDSDVFYALTRKASQGDLIATKEFFYQIKRNGTVVFIGRTSEIVKLIEEDKFETIPGLAESASIKSMLLSSARGLLGDVSSGNPLEVFASLLGARCADHTVWLKFSHTLHNVGEERVILYKEPLKNSQARFAATEADIQSGKYEKLVFFTPTQPDFSSKDSFLALSPGIVYSEDHEYPILGLDLRGKAAVQFLFFTWPPGSEKEVEIQRARWRDAGSLYAETIATIPIPLKVDQALLESCPAK